ncbi:hypothetical protein FB451DRAFT_1371167 [Mycena latifolia]|nr:hypothetical protein FB451DRAFT_1371167 [Mycena latifolia]
MSTAALRRRLAELDAAIVEEKRVLDALQRDRTAVQRQLHATSIFPVLTLPVEITAEIFSLCLPSIEELRVVGRLGSQAPTVFLGVCRIWRDIALGTPALWATLPLRLAEKVVVAEPWAVEEFVDMWLGRAPLRPLSIIFLDAHGPFTPSLMRDIIHRYAHKLKYIELTIGQDDTRKLELDSVAFPLLERAALDDPYYFEPNSSNPVHIFSNAPQLHDLILLDSTAFAFYASPWLQLTRFEGEINNLDLFMVAPNLVEVECIVAELASVPISAILHPRLQSLTLSKSQYSFTTSDIFPHLTLPALEFLHISASTWDSEDPTESLADFLVRSSPPLRTICACVEGDEFFKWDQCFRSVAATLQNLELHSPDSAFQYGLFNLGSQSSPHNPLPRLRTLHLVGTVVAEYDELADFLHRRSTTPTLAKFRSFRLISRPGAFLQDIFSDDFGTGTEQDEAIGHLPRFASQGIDIHIGTAEKTYVKHIQYIPGDPAYEFVFVP